MFRHHPPPQVFSPQPVLAWHEKTVAETLAHWGVNSTHGLSPPQAGENLARFGPNQLPQPKGPGALKRFLGQLTDPLVLLLILCGGVALVVKGPVDGGVIFGVVLLNAFIGFFQESRAVNALKALQAQGQTETTVIRAGQRLRLPAAGVVPGDLVPLQTGDRIPADLRLVASHALVVDESLLTGESAPVTKHTTPLPAHTVLAERANMAYGGTLVGAGAALGVVTATGAFTEVGTIARRLQTAETLKTPLTRQLTVFSHALLWFIVALAAATFVIGLWRGLPTVDLFLTAVALAVGAIPEGLPAALTITLAVGVARMARRGAIVRKLPVVETLGSATVICTDKTGTLTQNQMTVTTLWAGDQWFEATGTGYDPAGAIAPQEGDGPTAALKNLLTAGVLCNDSQLLQADGRWAIHGDPTEAALLVSAAKGGVDQIDAQEQFPQADHLPFDSQHANMVTLHETETPGRWLVVMKGAVEAVLKACASRQNSKGGEEPLDHEAIHRHTAALAAQGGRVLAFAWGWRPHAGLDRDDLTGLVFLGLQAMADPLRPQALAAVRQCHGAGITVKMLTGDHALTAGAIAAQLGLGGKGAPAVLTGQALENMDGPALAAAAQTTHVFARLNPGQKLDLVKALQQQGQVVAVTGDGVNDAPALRQGDIGVAMGQAGTEVAKEAADMVLTDDNFATIAAAVEEGRAVYENLTRFLNWALPSNFALGLVMSAAVALGEPLPILPLQALWVNMTTAGVLGLALAVEPKSPDLMRRPPRPEGASLVNLQLFWRVVLVGGLQVVGAFGLFHHTLSQSLPTAVARTVAVNMFVAIQVMYLFHCREENRPFWRVNPFHNPQALLGSLGMVGLQALWTWWGPMQTLFGTRPLALPQLGAIGAVTAAAFLVIALEKAVRFHWRGRPPGGYQ